MDRLSYKTLFLIIIFLLIPIVFLLRIRGTGKAVYAEWWNDSWSYRQAVNIASHSVGETNVYIVAAINIGSTAKAQADDGDFRFIDLSGKLLQYYVASGAGTTAPIFHIYLENFPAGAQTVYAYYGNSSADNGFSSSDFSTEASGYSIGSFSSEESGGAPVAWWKFDEGVGTTAHDSSQNQNHGAFNTGTSAPQWNNESQCISGRCLYFDGSTITVPNSPSLQITGSQTIMMWIKPLDQSVRRNPIAKAYGGEGTMTLEPNRSINYYWGTAGGNNNPYESKNTNALVTYNDWVHITLVRNLTSGNITWYLNGNQTSQSAAGYAAAVASTLPLTIGNGYAGAFKGYIDEIKIYNYPRSASQVKTEYDSGVSGSSYSNQNNSSFGSASQKGLSDGLVGYWKFDDNVGTSAADSSGNNNVATFGAGTSAPTWSIGKYGIGLSFDGTDDLASATDSTLYNTGSKLTISGWVYTTNHHNDSYMSLLRKDSQFNMYTPGSANRFAFYVFGDSANCTTTSNYSNWADNTWYFVTGTYDGQQKKLYLNGELIDSQVCQAGNITDRNNAVNFGTAGSTYNLAGNIDEVRIYGRSLSPTEVKQLYSFAPPPMAYFDLNEKTGSSVYDKSSNNIVATFNPGSSAPTWTNGRYGGGLDINGANAAGADFIAPNSFNTAKYGLTVSTWYKKHIGGGYILSRTGGTVSLRPSGNNVLATARSATGANSCTTSGNELADQKWHHLTLTYNGTVTSVFVDGLFKCSGGTDPGDLSTISGSWRIGGRSQLDSTDGLIDDIKIYNYIRSPAQILEDMGTGIGSKEPVLWYKFDDGQGLTARNSGSVGTTADGTLRCTGATCTIPVWKNESKFGKSLYFAASGTDRSYANTSYVSPFNLAAATGSKITISTWVNPNSTQGGNGWLVRNGIGYDENYGLNLNSTPSGGKYRTQLTWYDGTDFRNLATASYYVPQSVWSHLTAIISQGEWVKFYLNGNLVEKLNWINSNSVPSTSSFNVGGHAGAPNQYLNGYLDDFKVYNYDLSSEEIAKDYNRGSAAQFGQTSQSLGSTTTSLDYCVPGDTTPCTPPIAEWRFEEGLGISSVDSGGNSNNLTFGSGTSAPTWSVGKIGKGLKYNTINYASSTLAPNITGTAMTISGWVNTNQVGIQRIFTTSSPSTQFGVTGSNQIFVHTQTSNGTDFNTPIPSLPTDCRLGWHHLTVTWNTSLTSNNVNVYCDGVNIGQGTLINALNGTFNISSLTLGYLSSAQSLNGSIDQVRVYNYARTPSQVAYDYNMGEPVSRWKFDECQGNIVHDSVRVGFTGIISVGASGTQTSVGTCQVGTSAAWTNGAAGKFQSSLNLDGSDDFVTAAPGPYNSFGTSDFTISSWIKTSSSGSQSCIASIAGGALGFRFGFNGGKPYYLYGDGTNYHEGGIGTVNINDNRWHQITIVYLHANRVNAYVDGVYVGYADVSDVTGSINNNNKIWLGQMNGVLNGMVTGQVDDVQIFSYPLTPTQIKNIYNGSAVNFR